MSGYQLAAVLAVVVVAAAAIVRFEMFCLRELAETPDQELQLLTRSGWFAVIAVMIPIGGIAYLCCGRRRN